MNNEENKIVKVTKWKCPKCGKGILKGVEPITGKVEYCFCEDCGASIKIEVFYDFKNGELLRIGKIRNPVYLNLDNNNFMEGLQKWDELEQRGIPEYLGRFLIERIPIRK